MKKVISWTILLTGMCGAALAAARLDEDATFTDLLKDLPFWAGMAAVLLAIVINQKGHSKATAQSDTEHSISLQMSHWIEEILTRLGRIDRSDSLNARVAELASLQEELIFSVTDAKDRLIAARGFSFYARFMSDFAVAERFLARAWSAAVDGYPNESDTYLSKAENFFMQSKKILENGENRKSVK